MNRSLLRLQRFLQDGPSYLAIIAAIGFLVLIYRILLPPVNATTVALSLLLVVQVAAAWRGLLPGIFASLVGMLCFNFFFLPPIGTLTIEDPQNWAALTVFLITAVIASQLAAAAQARATESEKRREILGKLFKLGKTIIGTADFEIATATLAQQILTIFETDYCAILIAKQFPLLTPVSQANAPGFVRSDWPQLTDKELKAWQNHDIVVEELLSLSANTANKHCYSIPLKIGIKPIGIMVLISSFLEVSTLEALANLVALALERARFLEAVSHTAAVRQSDRLKSALLASVSHNLRTPLTAIRTSIDSLLRQDCAWDPQIQSEFHLIISEETYRLTQIVENLLAMARIEAGELKLLKQWSTVAEIFENVQERCATIMREHVLIVEQCETLPAIKVDSPLLAEVLANLLENAAKYTPTNSKIWLSACLEKQHLLISVIDEGPGIAPSEISRVFDKFYRGQAGQTRAPGTGMGLAIAKGIVEAHSGKIQVENILGGGAKFSFIIPVETKPLEELIANKDLYDAQTNNLSS